MGEKLGFIDLRDFTSVRQLRERIISIIEEHVTQLGSRRSRRCPPGQEFHFQRSRSFVMPSGLVAHTVGEFFELMKTISNTSLYFHFLESRLRLGRHTNDFSYWLSGRGETELAEAVDRLNPYTRTLDELKNDIVELGRKG